MLGLTIQDRHDSVQHPNQSTESKGCASFPTSHANLGHSSWTSHNAVSIIRGGSSILTMGSASERDSRRWRGSTDLRADDLLSAGPGCADTAQGSTIEL